jgi:hypothetical protein
MQATLPCDATTAPTLQQGATEPDNEHPSKANTHKSRTSTRRSHQHHGHRLGGGGGESTSCEQALVDSSNASQRPVDKYHLRNEMETGLELHKVLLVGQRRDQRRCSILRCELAAMALFVTSRCLAGGWVLAGWCLGLGQLGVGFFFFFFFFFNG